MNKKLTSILAIILCLGMLLGLASCSCGKKDDTAAADASASDAADADAATDEDKDADADDKDDDKDSDKDEDKDSDKDSEDDKSSDSEKTSYTAAEALELYKTAANKVKASGSKAVATRNKEVITTIEGEIPSMYSTFGFKEGTNTEKKTVSGSKLKSDFCVEGKDYVCNLSASDIKSATVTISGKKKIVNITVKNDTAGTYDKSSKCVSTISVPIGTWTCKGVKLKGEIDEKGNLVSLYYKMPTYVTSGSDAFAFSLEQYWTIAW